MTSNIHWLEWDGSIVNIDGSPYRLSCGLRKAIYPSPRQYVEVWAEMVDRTSTAYLETRARVGDHWGLSILQLHTYEDLERMCSVEQQLLDKQPAQLTPTII